MRKHKPNPVATSLGHLDQTRQGMRSTRPAQPEEIDDPTEYPPEVKSHVVVKFVRTGRNYMDLAGRFPHQSARGANYIMIMYSHDTGYIHVETPASRAAADIVACFERGIKFFSKGKDEPTIERIDNECSKEFRMLCKTLDITIELAPPGQHRTNAAERAIRTFKNHFIAVMSTTDKGFPLELWDELIAQAELTLNLMRTCRSDPNISAFEAVRGKFDINKTPIAPAGTRVVIHVKPTVRASWDTHGVEGFYIGPALEHYRCYRCYVISTASIRVTDTVAWHPEKLQMPGTSPLDALSAAINDLSVALQHFTDNPTLSAQRQPIDTLTKSISQQLRDLGAMFQQQEQSREIDTMFALDPLALTPPLVVPPPITLPGVASQRVLPQHPATPALALPSQIIPTAAANQRVPIPHPQTPPGFQPLTVAQPTVQIITTVPVPMQTAPTVGAKITGKAKQRASRIAAPPLIHALPVPIIAQPLTPKVTAKKQRVLTIATPPIALKPAQHAVVARSTRTAKQQRCKDYEALSVTAMRKLSQLTRRCIGLQYSDEHNAIICGTVSTVVRQIRNRKLYFQTWSHVKHTSVPTAPSDFMYISVEHAMRNYTWSIDTYTAQLIEQHLSTHAAVMTPENIFQELSMNTAIDMNADGSPLTSNSALKGPDAAKWLKAHGEEIVRLVESETGRFIQRSEMPVGRKAAYYNPQLKIKMKNGVLQYRVRGTIGGDQIDYPGATAAFVATLETVRVLSNAAVSEDANTMTADIADFYLGTPLDRPEYMRIALKHVPPDIIERYHLQPFIHDAWKLPKAFMD
jgi:hypothetical protein